MPVAPTTQGQDGPEQPSGEPIAQMNRKMVTLTVMLSAIMAIIDASIVNVALPAIGQDLHASVDQLSLVATGFILAGVLVMPLIGWLSAKLGRKRFFMISLGFFVLASMACGLAWSVESLAVFRVLQGLGGGTLIPISQAIMLESYPKEQHGKAMSTFGMGVTVGPALGPVLGGWITASYSWHWIFLINVPIGALALYLACRYLHDHPHAEKPRGPFDWPGLLAMIAGLTALQMVLEFGHRLGWYTSPWIIGLTLLFITGLVCFIRRELSTPHPIVDLSVMRERTFSFTCIINLMMGVSLFGVLVILPLFMEAVLKFDALMIGLILMPAAVANGMMMPLTGFLTDRFDPRWSIATGILLSAIGMLLLSALPVDATPLQMGALMALRGVGMSFLFVPLTTIAMSNVPTSHIAGASGLFTLIRQLGGSLGIAILTGLLAYFHTFYQQSMPLLQADQTAYENLFRISAVAFLLCLIPLCFMKRGHSRSEELSREIISH